MNSKKLFTKTDRPPGFQCNVIDSDWFENNPGIPPASDTLYVTLDNGHTTEFPVDGQELESGHLCSEGCILTLPDGCLVLAEWYARVRCTQRRNPGELIDREGNPYSPNIQLAAIQYNDQGMGRRHVFQGGSVIKPWADPVFFLTLINELTDKTKWTEFIRNS